MNLFIQSFISESVVTLLLATGLYNCAAVLGLRAFRFHRCFNPTTCSGHVRWQACRAATFTL